MNGEELRRRYTAGERNFAGLDLSGVNISGSNLTRAYLSGAEFQRTKMRKVDFLYADISGTPFFSADVAGAKNINTIDFSGTPVQLVLDDGTVIDEDHDW